MSEPARHREAPRRVLIVEDETPICELIGEILEDQGFEPVCAATDRQAYAALRVADAAYACLVVDVNLGAGVTGYDVARYARRLDPGLPVLFVSGQTSSQAFAAFGVAGSLLLPKPFAADDLLRALHTLVGDNDDAPAAR